MTQTGVLQFVIVGEHDHPLYDADLSLKSLDSVRDERPQYLYHFVMHASLDAVDDAEWNTSSMHLGVVDRFNNLQVSAFTTASRTRFLLLHEGKSDDAVKTFFKGVYELYLSKAALNPFFDPTSKILSREFNSKIKQLARVCFK